MGKKISKPKLYTALLETKGNLTNAAKSLGIDRSTIYEYIQDDPEAQAILQEARESRIDFVESALDRQIEDGNTAAIIFFLKTQGRSRGYVELKQTELSGSLDIQAKTYVSFSPDDWDNDDSDDD